MKKKNLAVILTKQKEKLKILNLDLPNVPKNYVLVKMKFSGICHTQLNEISGILGKDRFIPHCIGHEGVGEIIFTGIGIKNLKIGDKVVISWIKKKIKKKILPISYNSNLKKINTSGCNTLLNYSLVSEDRVFKINKKNKYLRESILLGCAIPTASNAILKNTLINKKSNILIMGMGGLGYASLLVLNYLKCENITCIDNNLKKLNLLKKRKGVNFQLINNFNIKKFVKLNNENFDLIIDCTGSKKLIEKTFSLCKRFVGKFIIIGNTRLNEKFSLNAWDFINGKTFTGAWGNGGTTMDNFSINEKILLNQIDNIKKLLSKKDYNLKNINKAIRHFKEGKILRPIVKF
jgi:Zn-dependent alcohol dehydrogenase